MPTTPTLTFSVAKLEPAFPEGIVTNAYPVASGSIAQGEVCGIVSATGKIAPYANGNNDGTETARMIAMYDLTADNSHVSLGTSLLSGEQATNAPFYIGGYFNCDELTGLDANAVTDLGRLVEGDTTTGVLRMT